GEIPNQHPGGTANRLRHSQCRELALPRHTVIANPGQLTRQERSLGRRHRRAESDPNVWSGRASQEVFVEVAVSGLASMYPASDWSVLCSGPPWISARVRPH